MPNQRKGLPSASEYPRIARCRGYLQLKRTLPPREEMESEDAASGTRIHRALNGEIMFAALSEEERDVAERCWAQYLRLSGDLKLPDQERGLIVYGERRLFLNRTGMPPLSGDEPPMVAEIFSGQIDRFDFVEKNGIGLMVDWKTGRIAVDPAEENLQIRAYAVLIGQHYSPDKLYAAVIQPWVSSTPTVVEYDAESIKKAYDEMIENLAEAEKPGASRTPGEWCKYCPCLAYCAEAKAVPMHVATLNPMAEMSNEEIAQFLDKVALAKQVIEAVQEEAKRRLEAGQIIASPDGSQWILRPGKMRSTITDSERVFARASEHGVTYEGFLQAITIQKGKLEDVLKAATMTKGEELKDILKGVLAGCVTEKQDAPSLAKEKAKSE